MEKDYDKYPSKATEEVLISYLFKADSGNISFEGFLNLSKSTCILGEHEGFTVRFTCFNAINNA